MGRALVLRFRNHVRNRVSRTSHLFKGNGDEEVNQNVKGRLKA